MKPDYIELIIANATKLVGYASTLAAAILFAQVVSKERSVGKEAIKKLKAEHELIKKEVEEMKRDQVEISKEVSEIQSKYEKFIEKMLNKLNF